ncbi:MULTISPECIES: PilT/PilU family type 4a pilus ATPase [Methylocaldum]|jgi:twitching motility protein PilU|uniref:PilT/PilU family type 4a pilus ATPase n=1 Tax=unclassified Methylocaldum TaxID=2622260 RepID=UPI00098AA5BA|nr:MULTISPECIES: PilT/PilU family type 4a pilus ATPase [unclassified Methylocaldum]MBP1151604.1 twitching motility protein PilU [Methylocaldum sp. RMAD-M]
MKFKNYLKLLVYKDGSDLYLTAGAPPAAKFQGKLTPVDTIELTDDMIKETAYSVMDEGQRRDFERRPEMNLAISEEGVGRFRVNIFKQRNAHAMVVRNIKVNIPKVDDLGLPEVLKNVIMEKRGLILFVGATGSGKSTSLAALIDYRNSNSAGHIITIEDPIEFMHPHKKCLVNQREVGVDTQTYEDALKNTLRQAPDVILIGEIRSQDTMEYAINFAETGHLCLSTLHANNSNQALDRIINFFPEERRNQLLLDLSLNLRAFVSQRLVPTVDGKRAAAIEILLGTPLVCDLIRKGEVHAIKEVMEKSEGLGMQTFDSHLVKLYQAGRITAEEAIRNADSANNVRLKISLGQQRAPKDTSPENTESPQDQSSEKTESAQTGESPFGTMNLSLEPVGDESEKTEESH